MPTISRLSFAYGVTAQTFATPKKHHKAKPFFDHVLSFTIADNRVWVRNYQVRAGQWRRGARACSRAGQGRAGGWMRSHASLR